MKTQGVSFRHAVKLLNADHPSLAAGEAHVVKKCTTAKLESPVASDADDQQTLLSVVEFYHKTLKESPEALRYMLVRPPERITVASIIRLMEGPLAPLPCASETRFRKCDECVDVETCGTRLVMREVRDAIAGILDSTTLAMVCEKVDLARQTQKETEALTYEI